MTDPNTKTPPPRTTVRIPTLGGAELDAWFYEPAGPGPHPAVVMGHGLGAVKAGGLAPFAERFCREGFAVVAIDYRQWGASSGWPRDELSVPRQRQDYSTAIGWAAAHPNIDAQRIFAWGTSFAGMHVTALAASDSRLAGAVAQCPLVDGLAGATLIRPSRSIRLMSVAVADRIGSLFGRPPIYLPISVDTGTVGRLRHPGRALRQRDGGPSGTGGLEQPPGRAVATEHLDAPARSPRRVDSHTDSPDRRRNRHAGSGSTRSTGGRTRSARRTAPQQGRPLRRVPGWRRL